MIESILSTNLHPIYDRPVVSRVEGESRSHPPPIYPRAQGSKALPSPRRPSGQEVKLLEAIRGYFPVEYFIKSFTSLRLVRPCIKLIFNIIKWIIIFFDHACPHSYISGELSWKTPPDLSLHVGNTLKTQHLYLRSISNNLESISMHTDPGHDELIRTSTTSSLIIGIDLHPKSILLWRCFKFINLERDFKVQKFGEKLHSFACPTP